MEWVDRLNQALSYIENHITEKIDYEELGKMAGCSSYHFQRMFNYMADIPLSEYIRRRKMSLAVADILSSREKIVDIALKYGYSSPTAFNRAFQSVHGISPSAVRKAGASVKSCPPISFKIMIKGVEEMEYRLESKEAFTVVGFRYPLTDRLEENFKIVPDMWKKFSTDGSMEKLLPLMSREWKGVFGISTCMPDMEWSYGIAVASPAEPADRMERWQIPVRTWAVFSGEGCCPQAIQELERRIFTEWLPASGYEYDLGPDLEFYKKPDPSQAEFEVWVPVRKKKPLYLQP
ncbi:MAG: AraC family transcriptional regulator [Ruminococcus sp.]